jgi:hypothetical protein
MSPVHEIRVDKETMEMLAHHTQATKERAQRVSLMIWMKNSRVPSWQEKRRNQPSYTLYSTKNLGHPLRK